MARAAAARSALGRDRPPFQHWALDPGAEPELSEAEAACRAAVERVLPTLAPPAMAASAASCDPTALAGRLEEPGAWSDFAVRPELTDVIAFHRAALKEEAEVAAARQCVVDAVGPALEARGWCPPGTAWDLSGHLWYPARTALGWHTNSRVPGWRAYLSWSAAPGSSFFRFLDPQGEVVTSRDTGFDLRLFHVPGDDPFWHCVWAGADRHAFGFRLVDAG